MATVRKVGKRQLKILCDCKRKHVVTADEDGEVEIETFNLLPEDLTTQKKEGEKNDGEEKKDLDIFDLLG